MLKQIAKLTVGNYFYRKNQGDKIIYCGTADDFVELYNPTNTVVDLSTWSVQKTTGTGTSPVKANLTGNIAAYGYYLVTRGDAAQGLLDLADDIGSASFSIAANNIVYLVSNQETIESSADSDVVDFVGLGSASFFEGAAAAANPVEGGSIERISGNPHADNMGNGWDTNDNFNDFLQNELSGPQNSSSAIEPEIIENPEEDPGEEPEEQPGEEPEEDPEQEPEEELENQPEENPVEDLNFFERILVRILSKFRDRGFPSLPSLPSPPPPELPIPTI